ncbi:AAA family ATPase [Flavobacterium frigoris]|uniref:AAA ATPase domain-containing protein n=1 Tax=Flavobacterium frigoris TaxID=229204 RepID=A0A1H9RY65_FLAFI|nr:AAA family ATPase [Flavobacterium frigoris]SER77053.1 AAA ATPase domain-containing protein [Flavobacterium frigoris]
MSNIKKYTIRGLFNSQDVEIPFDDNIKILIGENGLGKTTILNSLYFLLTKKWEKLAKIPFESIELLFDNNSLIYFTKNQLEAIILDDKRQKKRGNINIINQLKSILNIDDFKSVVFKNNEINPQAVLNYILKNKINQQIVAPAGMLVDNAIRLLTDDFLLIFEDINRIIDFELDATILYFPTYRRVEEDLQNLGQLRRFQDEDEYNYLFDEEDRVPQNEVEDEILIQFGMEDVEDRIRKVLTKINDSSLTGFTKVTAEILSQMLKGFPEVTDQSINKLNKSDIEIILNRVRGNLSDIERNSIIDLVESPELKNKRDLVFFLTKLIDIYYQQRDLDNSIKNFSLVCNKYLVGKQLVFNESLVQLDIIRTKNSQPVKMNQLSSGEKQIVSIFSKIYLEQHEKIIVLFDEPELSLSIEWQKMLLTHIVDSKKCDFLLAVTHSPFIFTNELKKYAIGMNVFID